MSASSSVILVLALVATLFTVLRLGEVRVLLSAEKSLIITDKGSHTVFAFATHYFFSVMMLCISGITTESSIFLEVASDKFEKITRLVCFLGLALATLVVFM
jgi:hypothetical protein